MILSIPRIGDLDINYQRLKILILSRSRKRVIIRLIRRSLLRSLALSPENLRANRAMMDLVNPTGLGDFKVLIQRKNVNRCKLWGLEPSSGPAALIDQLPFPLLTRQHIDLVQGRYPQGEYQVTLQELWPWDDAAGDGESPQNS